MLGRTINLKCAVILELICVLKVHGFVINVFAKQPGQVLPDDSGTQLNTITYMQYK
jgi:hypothetical protein